MSNTFRYIDIDSTYRNRNLYPNSSDFVIPVSSGFNLATNACQACDGISNAAPNFISTLGVGSTTTNIVFSTGASLYQNFYNGDYIQVGTQYSIISGYNSNTLTATLATPLISAPAAATQYYIRERIPIISSNLISGSTQNLLNLGPNVSNIDNSYNNTYIYFTSGVNIGKTALISTFTGSTQQAYLSKALPQLPGATDTYDILPYTRDNSMSLFYPGTTSFNQAVCYSIELLYLIIPDQVLSSGYGGTFDNYPYLYVKLFNEGNRHSSQLLYSNNPASANVLFRVPLGLNLRSETFFNLKDAKCVQVVKFNPNEAMRFTVTLPSGEPIILATPDNFSPLAPNPLLQISATFCIRRIDTDKDIQYF
jgi:hypothetical protein